MINQNSATESRIDPTVRSASALMVICGCIALLVLALATDRAVRPIYASIFMAIASLAAFGQIRRAGLYSLGSISLAVAWIPFFLKWLLNSAPASPRIRAFDNDQAMFLSGLFFTFLLVGYCLRLRKRSVAETSRALRETPEILLICMATLGLFAVYLRMWLASEFAIGVPGSVPSAPSGFGPLFGGLYYIGAYLPLGAALILFVARRRGQAWPALFGTLILITHVVVGAEIGSRGAVIFAIGILLLGAAWGPSKMGKLPIGPIILALIVAVLGLRFGVSAALASRGSSIADDEGDVIGFVMGRIGGLDHVSPILPVLHEPSLSYLSPSAWNAFLNVGVYDFPAGATHGSASSLPGWAVGVGGVIGAVLFGLVFGLVSGWLDRALSSSPADAVGRLRHGAVLLLWSILLLEGNIVGAVYAGLALYTLSIALSFVLVPSVESDSSNAC